MKYITNNFYQESNSDFIEYNKIFSIPDDIISRIKTNKEYKNWNDEDFKLLAEIAEYLSINKNITNFWTVSPFMALHLLDKNLKFNKKIPKQNNNESNSKNKKSKKDFFLDKIPFMKIIFESFSGKDNKEINLLPRTYNMLNDGMGFISGIIKEINNNKSTTLFLLSSLEKSFKWILNDVKINVDKILMEIREMFFENPSNFVKLDLRSKNFILSTFFDLLLIYKNFTIPQIRFSIISNLKKMGSNFIHKGMNIKKNNLRKSNDIYYFPINSMNDEKILKYPSLKYDIWNDPSTGNKYLIVKGPEELGILNSRINDLETIGSFEKIKADAPILYHWNSEISENEITHNNVKKNVHQSDIGNFFDFLWKSATKIIYNNHDIIEDIILKSNDDNLKQIILKCARVINSFKQNKDPEDIFLNQWFIIEELANSIDINMNWNDKIIFLLNKIAQIKSEKKIKSTKLDWLFKEITMYRNSIIHGDSPTNIRIGIYISVLNELIAYALEYIIKRKKILSVISLKNLISSLVCWHENLVGIPVWSPHFLCLF